MPEKVGNCQQQPMKEIWSGPKMKQLREDMLNEREHPACTRCYEQEDAGFFSGRKSANKHHGHQIKKGTEIDPPFEMTYGIYALVICVTCHVVHVDISLVQVGIKINQS